MIELAAFAAIAVYICHRAYIVLSKAIEWSNIERMFERGEVHLGQDLLHVIPSDDTRLARKTTAVRSAPLIKTAPALKEPGPFG